MIRKKIHLAVFGGFQTEEEHARLFVTTALLEEALSVSVTAKPTASERAPQWTKGSGGGVGG